MTMKIMERAEPERRRNERPSNIDSARAAIVNCGDREKISAPAGLRHRA
jgi:hypothetical protein